MIAMKIDEGQPVSGRLVYRAADHAFDTEPRPGTCGASFTVNELELMLDDEKEQRVLFVAGYCPHSSWRGAVLQPPVARPGWLRGEVESPVAAGVAVAVHSMNERWSVLVDEASGWVRIGLGSPNNDRQGVRFAPGSVAVLEDDRLVALWLHPDGLPSL